MLVAFDPCHPKHHLTVPSSSLGFLFLYLLACSFVYFLVPVIFTYTFMAKFSFTFGVNPLLPHCFTVGVDQIRHSASPPLCKLAECSQDGIKRNVPHVSLTNIEGNEETYIFFSATRLLLLRKWFFQLLGFSFNSFLIETSGDDREIDIVQSWDSIAVATSEVLVSRGKYTQMSIF